MLFKFKSKATGDVIMLEANGRHVLQIIGKDPSSTGIILPAQMPAALQALEAAIATEEAAIQAAKLAKSDPSADGNNHATLDTVPLRQRALPFMELLKNSHSAGVEVVWGV